jgi:hypothetical protein
MKTLRKRRNNTSLPVIIMMGFVLFLFAVLGLRVYLADQDLAQSRISRTQAVLAAESGVHYALAQFQRWLYQTETSPGSSWGAFNAEEIEGLNPLKWQKNGAKTSSQFRILEMTKLNYPDAASTQLHDESSFFSVQVEGRSEGRYAKATGILAVTDIPRSFAVANSLNEYYYGLPLQALASYAGGIDPLVAANPEIFRDGRMTPRGICHDPKLLYQMFAPGLPDPFKEKDAAESQRVNFGTLQYTSRNGDSPCIGPLYCMTPVVIDSHAFRGPVQTSLFLFRRPGTQSKVQLGQAALALNSSRRLQMAMDKLEGDTPEGILVDQDTYPKTAYLPNWRPPFTYLRQYAKQHGIYVASDGQGFLRGEPTGVDYHLGQHNASSEQYLRPVAVNFTRDEMSEPFIVLSTKNKFGGKNNLDSSLLKGARLLFSENSVFLRGDIGGDLVIVTPRYIFLTGSTNDTGPYRMLLVPGEGVALHTHDLEQFLATSKPSLSIVDAARKWVVRGVLYKPGAGWYCNWDAAKNPDSIVRPSDSVPGQRVSLTIYGACLEGNLQRWISHASSGGIFVWWDSKALERLPITPRVANLVRLRSILETN